MKSEFPLVEIEWVDAMTYCEAFHSLSDVRELVPIPAKTTGYLTVKTRDYIVVAMTIFAETKAHSQSIRQFWTIPRGCIKAIRILDKG